MSVFVDQLAVVGAYSVVGVNFHHALVSTMNIAEATARLLSLLTKWTAEEKAHDG